MQDAGRRRRARLRILHLAVCSFIAGCASHAARPTLRTVADPPDLAIVTWNLHGGAGDLPHLLEDLTSGRLTNDQPVTNFVLLLQEAGPDILEFAGSRGLSAYFEPVHPNRGNAIVSTHPLINARTIELPRERQRRVAVAANIHLVDTLIQVASAHFENRVSWWRGGLFSEGARLRQAQALVAALPPNGPTVVGGDFNAWLGRSEPAWRALAERFPDGPPPLPQPTFRQRLFLDELFFDVPEAWRVVRSIVESRYGSDHHAVVAELHLPS
jgi:endonuclease/exonuclease/phosphatase family metal-dependent hydrolase